MALSKAALKSKIVTEFEALGATASDQYSWVDKLATAIANAMVDEVQANATVPVTGGSSAGIYKVV